MPGTGSQFAPGKIVVAGGIDAKGLAFNNEYNNGPGPDVCEFFVWTGLAASGQVPAVPDIVAAAGTTVLIPAAPANGYQSAGGVPRGMRCYVTSIQIAVTTAFSGGTGGTVSLSLQDTAGTVIATFTQGDLTSGAYLSLPTTTLPGAVVDNLLKLMGPASAVNQGLQIVRSNSTAGVARVRLRGYYAP